MSRLEDLKRFYEILGKLEHRIGGARVLADCDGRMEWPQKGVYFFREPGEERSDTGNGLRIVRVGTHATTGKSDTKLWGRLKQHKGNDNTGGGNHRGSVFRREVGLALIKRDGIEMPMWETRRTAPRSIRESEVYLEQAVSKVIRAMPFLWVAIEDRALRGHIEQGTIALLSNYAKIALDAPSDNWLGGCSPLPKIQGSGLWNSDFVDASYPPEFLDELETAVNEV